MKNACFILLWVGLKAFFWVNASPEDSVQDNQILVTAYLDLVKVTLEEGEPFEFSNKIQQMTSSLPDSLSKFSETLIQLKNSSQSAVTEIGQIDEKLKEIDSLLAQVFEYLNKTSSLAEFLKDLEDHEQALELLRGQLRAVLNNTDEASLNTVGELCRQEKYSSIVSWYRYEMLGVHLANRAVLNVQNNHDRRLHLYFAKTLVAGIAKSTLLKTACTSVIFMNESAEALRAAVADDTKDYQRMLIEIEEKFLEQDKDIVQNFWQNAQDEMIKLTAANAKKDNQWIANHILATFESKYYWRKWFVLIYGGQKPLWLEDYKHHLNNKSDRVVAHEGYASYFQFWPRLSGKSAVLASPDFEQVDPFVENAGYCFNVVSNISTTVPKEVCDGVIQVMIKCMESTVYNAVGCVRDTERYGYSANSWASLHTKFERKKGILGKILGADHYELYLIH